MTSCHILYQIRLAQVFLAKEKQFLSEVFSIIFAEEEYFTFLNLLHKVRVFSYNALLAEIRTQFVGSNFDFCDFCRHYAAAFVFIIIVASVMNWYTSSLTTHGQCGNKEMRTLITICFWSLRLLSIRVSCVHVRV